MLSRNMGQYIRISFLLSCTSLLCISMFNFPFLSPRLSSLCFSCRRFSGRERPGWGWSLQTRERVSSSSARLHVPDQMEELRKKSEVTKPRGVICMLLYPLQYIDSEWVKKWTREDGEKSTPLLSLHLYSPPLSLPLRYSVWSHPPFSLASSRSVLYSYPSLSPTHAHTIKHHFSSFA